MRRTAVITTLAAAVSIMAVTPRPAAACAKRHQTPFELFDRATTVAIVRVRRVSTRAAQLDVVELLEGTRATALSARETNTSCHIGYRRGRRALVFLGADGWTAGAYEGYVEDVATWAPLVRRFAAATTGADRLAVVLDAIESTDPQVAQDGAYYLVDHPELLAQVDAAAHDRIVAAGGAARLDSMLPAVLVRLGDTAAAADLLAAHRSSRAASVTRLIDHRRFEAVDDPAALAAAIDAATDDGARIAAFERCERVRASALFPFTTYAHGVDARYWSTLADACRRGVPISR